MLRLFYTPHTCALASRIALEEAGAAYEAVLVDFGAEAQRSPDYLAVNPKGRVPALATDRGVLTETPAILAFVAQSFPEARLAPLGDPFAFAEAQAFNAYLCATVHVAHAHRVRGHRWADEPEAIEAMRRKAPRAVAEGFDLIERSMLRGPWVMREDSTVCDPYLFTLARWVEADGVNPVRLPRVTEHRRRVSERPAVRRAIAAELRAGG